MNAKAKDLIGTLILDVAIPEIMAAVRAHRDATGNLPTDAQVMEMLRADADRYIAMGEAFLIRVGEPDAAIR